MTTDDADGPPESQDSNFVEPNESEIRALMTRVSSCRTRLLALVPFFGHLALNLKPRVAVAADGVPTAGVAPDGSLILNYQYCKTLTDSQLSGLLCHEVLHPALFCWARQGTRKLIVTGPSGERFSLWNLCFPAGTYVTGAGAIESVAPGQLVTTTSGSARASQTRRHVFCGELHKIEGLGVIPFEATPEHPVLVATRKSKKNPVRLSEPEFIEASQIEVGRHYLVVPRVKPETDIGVLGLDALCERGRWGADDMPHNRKLRGGLPLTPDVAWSMGLYVANGCVSNGIRWTLNIARTDDRERLIQTWTALGFKLSIRPRGDVHAIDITVSSTVLARLFESLFGRGAANKRIPNEILFHENMFILGDFLRGYMAGDGCVSKGATIAATVSNDLIRQLQLAYARMGILSKIYRTKQRARSLGGYDLPAGEIWTLVNHMGKSTPRVMNGRQIECATARWKVGEDFILTPVKNVSVRSAEEEVFNFATPDHTYAVNNVVVHNCHDLSFNPEIVEMADRSEARGMIELPPGGAVDPSLKGMSAEEIYDKILKDAQNNKNGKNGKGGCSIQIPGNGKHGIGDDIREDLSDTQDGQKAAQGDKGAQTRLENDWKVSIVAAAQVQEKERGRGTLPAGFQKLVDELTDPKVDWMEVLSRWIGENGRRQDYTYRRPARRSESIGEYLPSLQKYGVDDIIILWDTSGSMNGRETEILSEVRGICDDLGISVRVMCCDTQVHSDVKNIQEALDVIPHIKGGGGSDFRPAFKIIEDEQFDGVVVSFTDGAIAVPQSAPPALKSILWVIGTSDVDPTDGRYGEVLRMTPRGRN